MGGREHDYRRTDRPRPDSAVKRRPGARHRRVPAEQDRRVMNIISSRNGEAVDRLLRPASADDDDTRSIVAAIVASVKNEGDAAVRRYSRKFDNLEAAIEVSKDEIDAGVASVPRPVRAAIAA